MLNRENTSLKKLIFKPLLCLILVGMIPFFLYGADGFREFEFGESPQKIESVSEGLCSFGALNKHTRWPWRSYAVCKNYRFKGNRYSTLHLFFSEDELVKVHVVSKDIPFYLLRRYPEYNYLLPKARGGNTTKTSNLADRLLFKDKVHTLGDEYQYITFYYEGKWEWEYIFTQKGYAKEEDGRMEDLKEDELEAGVPGWNRFKFNDSLKVTKENLEGMCASIEVIPAGKVDITKCNEFPFLDKKIEAFFVFEKTGLSKIELKLTEDWYSVLIPLLKRKYGLPYLELEDNPFYYPSIEFPKANVVLAYKRESSDSDEISLALKYIKRGFEDTDIELSKKKTKTKSKERPKTKSEKILESI